MRLLHCVCSCKNYFCVTTATDHKHSFALCPDKKHKMTKAHRWITFAEFICFTRSLVLAAHCHTSCSQTYAINLRCKQKFLKLAPVCWCVFVPPVQWPLLTQALPFGMYSGSGNEHWAVTFESGLQVACITSWHCLFGQAQHILGAIEDLRWFQTLGHIGSLIIQRNLSWWDNRFRCFDYRSSSSYCKGQNPSCWPLSAMPLINLSQHKGFIDCGIIGDKQSFLLS